MAAHFRTTNAPNTRKTPRSPQPDHVWVGQDGRLHELYEPGNQPAGLHAALHAADAEHAVDDLAEWHDADDASDELTYAEAAEALTELTTVYDSLSPGEQAITDDLAEAAGEYQHAQQAEAHAKHVLGEIVQHLDAGYSVERFAEALHETGDLEHALHVTDAYGREPQNLDDAIGVALGWSRQAREAEHQ
jgi:hypothetical protein